VTLELGGKSPCVVWHDADLEVAARRIMWGKTLNCGQTCVAPDYVLVHKKVKQAFCEAAQRTGRAFYGETPQTSNDYGRIVSERHFDRLIAFLKDGRVVFGGRHDRQDRYLEPTLLEIEDRTASILQEELFGPLLPLVAVADLDEAIRFIRERPKPLALYLFTRNKRIEEQILAETSSGGVCVNDTINQLLVRELPFGGVGDSGFGRYHGHASFACFSNEKSVLQRGCAFDARVKYPPYTISLKTLKRMLRWLFG
jgi:acyl-CoA reductase-like NAD-dependent aldehyde dehydrogenase